MLRHRSGSIASLRTATFALRCWCGIATIPCCAAPMLSRWPGVPLLGPASGSRGPRAVRSCSTTEPPADHGQRTTCPHARQGPRTMSAPGDRPPPTSESHMPRSTPHPSRDPDGIFRSFVRELVNTDSGVLNRLTLGHSADDRGWCRQVMHEHHWERHPCPVLGLASLVEATAAESSMPS